MLKEYHTLDETEVGIDEAGRGCLMGPVCVGAVVLPPGGFVNPPFEIKDSKKMSAKKRKALRTYIETNALAYSVNTVDIDIIDRINILQATMKGMHACMDDICKHVSVDTILVDGTYFPIYTHPQTFDAISHRCIPGGDNQYQSIAAASILAKEYRDEYMEDLVSKYPVLEDYGIHTNKGYGTAKHMEALYKKGVTQWHRQSFEPCKSLLIKELQESS